jgi:hypothetical protein
MVQIALYDDEKQPILPVDARLIGTITGIDPTGFGSEHARKIKIASRGYTGCMVIVFDNGNVRPDGIYKIYNVIIGPPDKGG